MESAAQQRDGEAVANVLLILIAREQAVCLQSTARPRSRGGFGRSAAASVVPSDDAGLGTLQLWISSWRPPSQGSCYRPLVTRQPLFNLSRMIPCCGVHHPVQICIQIYVHAGFLARMYKLCDLCC